MMGRDPIEIIGEYGARIDARAEAFLTPNDYALYGMMRYFMGYTNEKFVRNPHPVGKRFRPGLALFIAEQFGLLNETLGAALSIELFHNFTLIHDDVVDHDELRRGRPTVWRVWGVDHAINTGDAQLLLALRALEEKNTISLELMATLRARLLALYLEVIEGQYLDFTLAASKLNDVGVNEQAYLTMLQKKTARLVRSATEVAPLLAGADSDEVAKLGDFGENLGMAYQLYDDWQSVWGVAEKTGKKTAGDIYERKKTLPVIYAREHLLGGDRARLIELYDHDALTEESVTEVLALFEKTDAKNEVEKYAARYKAKALESLRETKLSDAARATLAAFIEALVPSAIPRSQ